MGSAYSILKPGLLTIIHTARPAQATNMENGSFPDKQKWVYNWSIDKKIENSLNMN